MHQHPVTDGSLSPTDPLSVPLIPSSESNSAVLPHVNDLLTELSQIAQQLNMDDSYTPSQSELCYPTGFRLSIVMPVFNEEQTVRQVIARLLALEVPNEIIVVDDGSTDATRDILNTLAELPNLHVVLKTHNEGKGAAVRTGFEHATGDIILVQDADLEYDPRDIPQLLQPILSGRSDVVYGSRFLEDRRRGSSKLHGFGNRMLTKLSNLTTGLRLTDMETCYKAFRKDVIKSLSIRQDRFGFEPEVTAKLARRGYDVIELPVRYNARAWGDGKKIGIKDGFEALFCIFRYAWCD